MDSLPEDMENRRLADLERFALNNPNHPMVPLLMKQVRGEDLGEREAEAEVEFGGESQEGFWYQWLRDCQQLKPASKAKRQLSGKQGAINKWDKTSSLELLGAVKRLEDTLTELSLQGIRVTSDSRWATISQNVPNRYGLEQAKFTRSCRVHFAHLCRAYKVPRRNSKGEDLLDPQVHRALEELFHGGETCAPLPRRQGFEAKSSGDRGENVNNSNVPTTEKTDPRGKHLKTPAPARQIPEEPPSNVLPNQTLNGGSQVTKKSERRDSWEGLFSRNNQSTKVGERTRIENRGDVTSGAAEVNDDPREQEPNNPHRQEQREKPPTTGNIATLKRWDTDRSLPAMASRARVDGKAENRSETIASQVPNHGRLDPPEPVRGCKEQYQDVPRIYKRPSCKENSVRGHKPLADEASSQLDKWLQSSNASKAHDPKNTEIPRVEKRSTAREKFLDKWLQSSNTSKAHDPKNTEIPRAEKRSTAPEKVLDKWLQSSNTSKAHDPKTTEIPRAEKRSPAPEKVAAKPAFKPGVTKKKTAEDWIGGITKNSALPKEKKRGPVAENVVKAGSMKANCALPNYDGLDHSPMESKNGYSSNKMMPLDSDSNSDSDHMVWEYRKCIKKRSIEQDGEEQNTRQSPLTGNTGHLDGKRACTGRF